MKKQAATTSEHLASLIALLYVQHKAPWCGWFTVAEIKPGVLLREKLPGLALKHERSLFARGSKKRGIKVTGGVTFYTSFEVQPATAIMLKRKCTQCTRGIKFTSMLHNVPYVSRGAPLHPSAVHRWKTEFTLTCFVSMSFGQQPMRRRHVIPACEQHLGNAGKVLPQRFCSEQSASKQKSRIIGLGLTAFSLQMTMKSFFRLIWENIRLWAYYHEVTWQ